MWNLTKHYNYLIILIYIIHKIILYLICQAIIVKFFKGRDLILKKDINSKFIRHTQNTTSRQANCMY